MTKCPRCGSPLNPSKSDGLCPQCVARTSIFGTSLGKPSGNLTDATPPAFGDYELLEEAGRGAMGVVYRARQRRLNRVVALKMILSGPFASEAERRRFQAEAEAVAGLDHPNIVPIYEFGERDGRQFYAMRWLSGGSLTAGADQKQAAGIIARISRAVHYAHQRGVLHRDLKPGNILLDEHGEFFVADFGLARRTDAQASLTVSGSPLGTPCYMSPEQALGKVNQLTTATDIYSLGAMLYELLAGRPPFKAVTQLETIRQVAEQEPPRIHSFNSSVDPDLETICLKCLEKDPQLRYNSAASLADDLERFVRGEIVYARPSSDLERIVKWIRRNRAKAGLGAALVAVFLAGVAGVLWEWRVAESALKQSQASLWQANFDRAHALRTSGQMGQRVESLKAIKAAAAIRPTPELRNEAIAAMALTDLEDTDAWYPLPTGSVGRAVDSQAELIAFNTSDRTVEIRGFKDRQLRSVLPGSQLGSCGLQFNLTGNLLAVRDRERLRMWDWRSTNFLADCPAGNDADWSFPSPDGRWLSYNASTSSVVIVDVRANREAGRLENLAAPHLGSFSPGGQKLALQAGGNIEVWDWKAQRRVAAIPMTDGAYSVNWLEAEPLLAIGCEDANLYLWDMNSGRTQKLSGHRGGGIGAAWQPGGKLIASVGWDDVLRLWDPFAGVQLLETTFARSSAFTEDGRFLMVGNPRGIGLLKVCHADECRLFHLPLGWHNNYACAFSPDDRFVAASSPTGLSIWEVASGKRVFSALLPGRESIEFVNENSFVSVGHDGVLLWTNTDSAGGWRPSLQTVLLPAGDERIKQGVFSRDHSQLILQRGATGEVYDFPSLHLRQRLEGERLFGSAAFSADAQWLASGYWDNTGGHRSEFRIWSAADAQTVRQIPMGNCKPFFSSDGRWLLAASDNMYFQFAVHSHPTNWEVVHQYPRPSAGIVSGAAAFSSDASLMALQMGKTDFSLVESNTGRELARLTAIHDTDSLDYAVFSHNDRWFTAQSNLGLVVWDLALIRRHLREMNLDWDGPPNLPVPDETSAAH